MSKGKPGAGAASAAAAAAALRPAALPPFELLVTRHGAAVLRVCRALVGVVDADDVWQETFLAALRAYPSSGPRRNPEAWIITIARHKAIDHHRKSERLDLPAGSARNSGSSAARLREGGQDARLGGGDTVVRSVEAGETAEQVWAALAKLPPTQREAVVYHHLAGLRYADVAELLGNSEVAARRAAADGIKALRVLLALDEGSELDGR